MNDAVNPNPDSETAPIDELDMLKKRAAVMGLNHHPNIGVDALRKKVSEALNGPDADTSEEDAKGAEAKSEDAPVLNANQKRAAMRAEQLKLVRLRITNMNPSKADLHGEIFTVANKVLGIVKKFIPYGEATDDGYHVPYVIYQQLKDRKFLFKKSRKNQTSGQTYLEQRWVKEFALEVLDPLTEAELKDLAASQAAKGGVSD